MAHHVHIHLHRATKDNTAHDPSNGQFTSGSGGGGHGMKPYKVGENYKVQFSTPEHRKHLESLGVKLRGMEAGHVTLTPQQASSLSSSGGGGGGKKGTKAAKAPAKMSFIQILNHPEGKELVEQIEDMSSSLRDKKKGSDPVLEPALAHAKAELLKRFGHKWED